MQSYTRLSDNERLFLAASAFDADASVKELAARSGLSQHATRHVRDSLLRRELIIPMYHIDHFALGYLDLTIYFNRGAESSAGQKRLEKTILAHPRVMSLNRMGGGYRYMLWFFAKRIHEADDLFSILRPTEPGAHFDKTVRIAHDWSVFTPNYLSPGLHRRERIDLTSRTAPCALDQIDERILQVLSANPAASSQGIARTMGMSASSLQYRLDKLTEQRIIRGKIYVLRTDKMGVQTYRLLIVDRGLNQDQKKHLYKAFAQSPNVVATIACTGSWDFELRFETENSRDLDTFCQTLYDTFGGALDSIKIIQQFETLKRVSHPTAQRERLD